MPARYENVDKTLHTTRASRMSKTTYLFLAVWARRGTKEGGALLL